MCKPVRADLRILSIKDIKEYIELGSKKISMHRC